MALPQALTLVASWLLERWMTPPRTPLWETPMVKKIIRTVALSLLAGGLVMMATLLLLAIIIITLWPMLSAATIMLILAGLCLAMAATLWAFIDLASLKVSPHASAAMPSRLYQAFQRGWSNAKP